MCIRAFDPVVGLNAGKLFSDMPGVDGVNDQYEVFNGSQAILVVSQRGIRSGMPILSVAGRCLRNRKFSMDCHDTLFHLLHRENVRKTTSTDVVAPRIFLQIGIAEENSQ